MFKTAAQIADGEDANDNRDSGLSLFVSAADPSISYGAQIPANPPHVGPHLLQTKEPDIKHVQSSQRHDQQLSPVKRRVDYTAQIPPSITRLLGTVKERLIEGFSKEPPADLEKYQHNLHIFSGCPPKRASLPIQVSLKHRDSGLNGDVHLPPKLSNSHKPGAATVESELSAVFDAWSLLVESKIYDCLSNVISGRTNSDHKALLSKLVSISSSGDTYFDMLAFMQRLLTHYSLLSKCSSDGLHNSLPAPMLPSNLILKALSADDSIDLVSLQQFSPQFIEVLRLYKDKNLLYDPYSDALIGRQKALKRHEEMGCPRFYSYLPLRTSHLCFEQLSVVYGATIFPGFDPTKVQPADGIDPHSLRALYRTFHEYEFRRLSFYSGTLAENFCLCKSIAFFSAENPLKFYQGTTVNGKTMYQIDTELISLASTGNLEDSKFGGMLVLPYSHELEELVICGRQDSDSYVRNTSEDENIIWYYNPTIAQHEEIISLLYAEICHYSDKILTPNRMYLILIVLGLQPKVASYEWFLFQLQLSVFRLAKTQFILMNASNPEQESQESQIKTLINPYSVLLHCMIKYKLEFDTDFVPLLKKIHRQDLVSTACTGAYLILDTRIDKPVSSVHNNAEAMTGSKNMVDANLIETITVTPPLRAQQKQLQIREDLPDTKLELLLTDGFYLVRASVDPLFYTFMTKHGIQLCKHEKIVVSLPQSINFGSAQDPPIHADWKTEAGLVLTYYNTRRVSASHFLGRCRRPFASTSLTNAISFALETRLHIHQTSGTNLIPHMAATVIRIFDPIMVTKRITKQQDEQADKDATETPVDDLKTYYYRRILVIDSNLIDVSKLTKLQQDTDATTPSIPSKFLCFFLHQFGSKAGIIESFEPGLQIELISTSIRRYTPLTGKDTRQASQGYFQLSPSIIICSQAVNNSLPRGTRSIFESYYQQGLFYVHTTSGDLEQLQSQIVFFYCLGADVDAPPLYCFRLSSDSTRIFDLIEVIQSTSMNTVYVHSPKSHSAENLAIEFRSAPRKFTKLTITDGIIQGRSHGRYKVICLDETNIKVTGETFFYENEEQTKMYVQLLEESIQKYL